MDNEIYKRQMESLKKKKETSASNYNRQIDNLKKQIKNIKKQILSITELKQHSMQDFERKELNLKKSKQLDNENFNLSSIQRLNAELTILLEDYKIRKYLLPYIEKIRGI